MTPERRIYHLGEGDQPQTMVSIHSTPEWDLYLVYEGVNPDTGQPIMKAFLNPLVGWIWFGLAIIVFGTFVALVPSLSPATAALQVPAARAVPVEAAIKGRRLMGNLLHFPSAPSRRHGRTHRSLSLTRQLRSLRSHRSNRSIGQPNRSAHPARRTVPHPFCAFCKKDGRPPNSLCVSIRPPRSSPRRPSCWPWQSAFPSAQARLRLAHE